MLFLFLEMFMPVFASTVIAPPNQTVDCKKLEVWFPPKDKPYDRLVGLVDNAKESIWVQAYQLTSDPISEALVCAYKRGVKIIIVVDKTQTGGSSTKVPDLVKAGLEIWIDSKPPIAHNKVFVIDKKTTIGGSFNYSKNAGKNAENMTVYLDQPKVAALYLENIERRKKESTLYADYVAAREKRNQDKLDKQSAEADDSDGSN